MTATRPWTGASGSGSSGTPLHGWEIVDSAARLCAMNLYLHGIGGDETNITVDDSLRAHPGVNYDLVLTNPPFGRKSSLTFVNSEGESERESLTVERPTSGPPPATSSSTSCSTCARC